MNLWSLELAPWDHAAPHWGDGPTYAVIFGRPSPVGLRLPPGPVGLAAPGAQPVGVLLTFPNPVGAS